MIRAIVFLFVSSLAGISFSASTNATLPGSGTNEVGTGTVAWSNPERITADDGSYATFSMPFEDSSNYLVASNFSFTPTVPSSKQITGLIVEFEKSATSGLGADETLIFNVGSSSSTNKANVGSDWPGSDTIATYGSATDNWGISLTGSDLTNLKLKLSVVPTGISFAGAVDFIQVTVFYAGGSSFAAFQEFFD